MKSEKVLWKAGSEGDGEAFHCPKVSSHFVQDVTALIVKRRKEKWSKTIDQDIGLAGPTSAYYFSVDRSIYFLSIHLSRGGLRLAAYTLSLRKLGEAAQLLMIQFSLLTTTGKGMYTWIHFPRVQHHVSALITGIPALNLVTCSWPHLLDKQVASTSH